MSGDHDESFRRFVVDHRRALLRSAFLLTGDNGHAVDLVQAALLKTYRHWDRVTGRGDPTAYVRRVLATTSTSWWRRRSSGELVIESFPDRPADAQQFRDDELIRALQQLPPRMRAVVVLRFYEDQSRWCCGIHSEPSSRASHSATVTASSPTLGPWPPPPSPARTPRRYR